MKSFHFMFSAVMIIITILSGCSKDSKTAAIKEVESYPSRQIELVVPFAAGVV
jgi:tripartite-type tricarboxylate transporter receptor subunit TctC